jgi:hypothetical protein
MNTKLLEQIEGDGRYFVEHGNQGWAHDALALCAEVRRLVGALRRIVDGNHMGRAGDTALSIAREAVKEYT